jgi:NAD(P)H-flavin reductase
MFEILERKMIVPNLHMLVLHAPDIVEEIQPGQFVIGSFFASASGRNASN